MKQLWIPETTQQYKENLQLLDQHSCPALSLTNLTQTALNMAEVCPTMAVTAEPIATPRLCSNNSTKLKKKVETRLTEKRCSSTESGSGDVLMKKATLKQKKRPKCQLHVIEQMAFPDTTQERDVDYFFKANARTPRSVEAWIRSGGVKESIRSALITNSPTCIMTIRSLLESNLLTGKHPLVLQLTKRDLALKQAPPSEMAFSHAAEHLADILLHPEQN